VSLCSLYYCRGKNIEKYSKEAEKYDFPDQMSVLRRIQGDIQYDKKQYSESVELYAQSCLNALRHNRYLLDEIIDHIIKQTNKLIKSDKKKKAIELCNYLINFWKDYEDKENKSRQSDIGDGKKQHQLINRMQSEKERINIFL
jgi:hypothetical protein